MLKNRILLTIILLAVWMVLPAKADNGDYKTSAEFVALRDAMHRAFNNGDTAAFYPALRDLEDYLLKQGDLHAYYTQRCNEIVFQLNRQHIFEAYKLAKQLSKELTERNLEDELYMAINMEGHIYNYCDNKELAKKCFWDVIHRMEKAGYVESQTAIYMNLVNIVINEDPQEALTLIDKALKIAEKVSPERVFDIETRRTLAYYKLNDLPRFYEGYNAYKEGVRKGLTSVHGRTMEIYYLASKGRTDEAIQLASQSENDPYETMAEVYSKAGRWQEAYHALQKGVEETDSINGIILSSSMQGIQEELQLYEAERRAKNTRFYALCAIVILLLMLVLALVYIVRVRRRHLAQMQKAYERILESDRMKTSFIQNVSHEIRTPLNIISGFAQIITNPDYEINKEERAKIGATVRHNTHIITTMIDEVLDMSILELTEKQNMVPLKCADTIRKIVSEFNREMGGNENLFVLNILLPEDFTLMGQEHILRNVLTPLLDNAVKNSPESEQITIRATNDEQHLVIFVEDKGTGVPEGEAEHIFEHFVKLDDFKEGLGLGLTFSRSVARHFGGDVMLDTTYKEPGARFKIVL